MNYLQQSTILIRWQPRNSKILQLYFYKEHLFCLTLQFLIFLLTLIRHTIHFNFKSTIYLQTIFISNQMATPYIFDPNQTCLDIFARTVNFSYIVILLAMP